MIEDDLTLASSIHVHALGEPCNDRCNTPEDPYRKVLSELTALRRELDEARAQVQRVEQ